MEGRRGAMPARYASNNDKSTMWMACFIKQSDPNTYTRGDCRVTIEGTSACGTGHTVGSSTSGSSENWQVDCGLLGIARSPDSPHNSQVIPRLLNALTSRRVSLALMVFIVFAAIVGVVVPQRSLTSIDTFAQWESDNPLVAGVVGALSFDHVFSSWWFLSGLALFGLSLTVATWRMLRTAWLRSTRAASPRIVLADAAVADIAARARGAGYRPVRGAGTHVRLVRHQVGWWGPSVLHVGMVLTLLAATISLALTSRAVVDLSIDEVFEPGGEFLVVEPDFFGGTPNLNTALRFDGLTTEYWPTGELQSWVLTMSVADNAMGWLTYESTPNDPLDVQGHTIYLSVGDFGNAAFVTFADSAGEEQSLRVSFPQYGGDEPSYTDVVLSDGTLLEARWDPQGARGEKLLTIREAGEAGDRRVTLDEGDAAMFGDLSVDFEFAGQWARLIVVRPIAVLPLFLGFAIIALGSLMIYLWVPREIILAEEPGGVRYTWRAARMSHLYLSEKDEILGLPTEETQ